MAIVPKVISPLGFRGYLNETNAISPPRPFLGLSPKKGRWEQAQRCHSGLEGESTQIALMQGDEIVQTPTVRLGTEANQEVRFVMDRPPSQRRTRFRILATPVVSN